MTLPETVTVDFQPYGRVTLGNLRLGDYRGFPTLIGTVIEGTERAYLCGHTTSRSTVGETRTVYGIQPRELARAALGGHIVRIAM